MRYTAGDASKMMSLMPVLDRVELHPSVSDVPCNGLAARVYFYAHPVISLISLLLRFE